MERFACHKQRLRGYFHHKHKFSTPSCGDSVLSLTCRLQDWCRQGKDLPSGSAIPPDLAFNDYNFRLCRMSSNALRPINRITNNQRKIEPAKVKSSLPVISQTASMLPPHRLMAAAPKTPRPTCSRLLLNLRYSQIKASAIPMNTAPRMFT